MLAIDAHFFLLLTSNTSSDTDADKERFRGATFDPRRKDGDTTPLDEITAAVIEIAVKDLEESPAYEFFPEIAEYLIKYLKCIRPGDICHFRLLLCAVQILRGAFAGAFGCLCNADCKFGDNICMRLLKAMAAAFEDSSLVVGDYLENVSGANQDFVCPNPGEGYEHCPAWTIKACVLMGGLYQITFKALLDVGCKVTVHNLSGPRSKVVYFVQSLTPAVTGHENMYINMDTSHIVNLGVPSKVWSASFQVGFQRSLYRSIASTLTEASGVPSNLCQLLLDSVDAKYFVESTAEIAILQGNFKDTLVSILCFELYKGNGEVNVFSSEVESAIDGIDIVQTYVKNNLPDLVQMFPDDVSCREDVTIRQAHALMSSRGRAKALANGNLFGGSEGQERGRATVVANGNLFGGSEGRDLGQATVVDNGNLFGGSEGRARAQASQEVTLNTQWEKRFAELVKYKADNGDCLVASNTQLGSWVSKQRQMYKKKEKSENEIGRIEKLSGIDFGWGATLGTSQVTLNTKWDEMYAELVEYKEKNGHCKVPDSYKANGKRVGDWVNRQRILYKLFTEGKKSSMTQERINKLNSLKFVWVAKVTWEERFEELVEYKEKNGHCKVPTGNAGLGKWVSNQRTQYKLFTEGKKSNITQDRIDKLNGIRFDWVLTGGAKLGNQNAAKPFHD